MATSDRKVDIFLKKFLAQQEITTNFFDYLEQLTKDLFGIVYPINGVFSPDIATTTLLSSSVIDTFTVFTPLTGTDGAQGNLLIPDPLNFTSVPFQNTAAIPYFIGARFNRVPRESEINVRTGKIKFTFLEEAIGELADPDSVVDDGDETLTVIVDSVTEAGVSNAGRKVRIWLKDPKSEAQLFEDLTVLWDGSNNKIETTTALGQIVGSISTTASDYQVFLIGPTVKRNTDLRLDSNILFLGIVTGIGLGSSPTGFNQTDVNNLSVPIGALGAFFGVEHDITTGIHSDINPDTITTKQTVTGVQLATQVNASDEDTPDVPASHTLFPSGGGSGIQGIKWRILDSGGTPIAFIDAHGNAYFQNISAVATVFQSTIVVEGSSTFGDDIATDTVTFNSVLQSLTDMDFLIDANNDGAGHAYNFYNNSVLLANLIFKIQEDGQIQFFNTLFTNDPTLSVDLDSDNDQAGETWSITKNAGATLLWFINEFGDGNATRDLLTAAKTVYSDILGNALTVDASLNEVHDESLARKLLKITPNSPNDTIVNVAGSSITAADGSVFTLPFGTIISGFTGGLINFETGVVTGGANFTPTDFTANPDEWIKYSINLLTDDTLLIIPATGFGATQSAAPNPLLSSAAIAAAVVAVQNDSGVSVTAIRNISESNFTRLPFAGEAGAATGESVSNLILDADTGGIIVDNLGDIIFKV